MLPYWGAIFTAWYFLYIKNKKKLKLQSPELYCKSQHKSGKGDCSELSPFSAEYSPEDNTWIYFHLFWKLQQS